MSYLDAPFLLAKNIINKCYPYKQRYLVNTSF
jgi:hypothetical protein